MQNMYHSKRPFFRGGRTFTLHPRGGEVLEYSSVWGCQINLLNPILTGGGVAEIGAEGLRAPGHGGGVADGCKGGDGSVFVGVLEGDGERPVRGGVTMGGRERRQRECEVRKTTHVQMISKHNVFSVVARSISRRRKTRLLV